MNNQKNRREELQKAWDNFITNCGEEAPKQIKKSVFIIQHHLFQFKDPALEDDKEIRNASDDLKFLYQFIEEIEGCFTTSPN